MNRESQCIYSQYNVEKEIINSETGEHEVLIYNTKSGNMVRINLYSWRRINGNNIKAMCSNSEVQSLIEKGFLLSEKINEVEQILKENREDGLSTGVLYYSIQPSAFCPFGCHYCGQKHSSNNLSKENQDYLFNNITEKLKKGSYKKLSIGWFGGEPLAGYSVIKSLSSKLIKHCDENKIGYGAKIVTNGYLINSRSLETLVKECKIKQFEITLDGIADYHDNRRHTKDHKKTFDQIFQSIKLLSKYPKEDVQIIIRCNVDARNKDGIIPLIDYLHEQGLSKRVYVYFAPIHSWGNDAHLLSAEKKEFADWEVDWLIHLIEKGFAVNLLPQRKKTVCLAVDPNSELIDPFGGVYNCTEVSITPHYVKNGRNVMEIGHVSDPTKRTDHSVKEISPKFNSTEVISKYPCYSCPILPICGGACPKEWQEGRSPCPSIKNNLEERILLQYIYRKAPETNLKGVA